MMDLGSVVLDNDGFHAFATILREWGPYDSILTLAGQCFSCRFG